MLEKDNIKTASRENIFPQSWGNCMLCIAILINKYLI